MSCKKDEEYILLDILLYGQTLSSAYPQTTIREVTEWLVLSFLRYGFYIFIPSVFL
ncbi:MAG: hypothetical protein U9P79_04095 [Candidatus Cloacimonadota bacterium]|nr:hypothetical protein [Candidatus Cloacimonadota bacterium]